MKRKANRGESLVETMFALLVGSISVMLLATMISASAKLIRLGEENADDYTTILNEMNRSVPLTKVTETGGYAAIRFDSNGDGRIDAGDTGDNINVKIKSFRDGGSAPVVAYEKDTGDT